MNKVETLSSDSRRVITVEKIGNGLLVTGATSSEMQRLNDHYDNGMDFSAEGDSYRWDGLFGVADLIIADIDSKEFTF